MSYYTLGIDYLSLYSIELKYFWYYIMLSLLQFEMYSGMSSGWVGCTRFDMVNVRQYTLGIDDLYEEQCI